MGSITTHKRAAVSHAQVRPVTGSVGGVAVRGIDLIALCQWPVALLGPVVWCDSRQPQREKVGGWVGGGSRVAGVGMGAGAPCCVCACVCACVPGGGIFGGALAALPRLPPPILLFPRRPLTPHTPPASSCTCTKSVCVWGGAGRGRGERGPLSRQLSHPCHRVVTHMMCEPTQHRPSPPPPPLSPRPHPPPPPPGSSRPGLGAGGRGGPPPPPPPLPKQLTRWW